MSVLVGKKAPDFSATAVKEKQFIENFKLSDFKGRKAMKADPAGLKEYFKT